jgi:hypothetical protein
VRGETARAGSRSDALAARWSPRAARSSSGLERQQLLDGVRGGGRAAGCGECPRDPFGSDPLADRLLDCGAKTRRSQAFGVKLDPGTRELDAPRHVDLVAAERNDADRYGDGIAFIPLPSMDDIPELMPAS